VLRQSHSWRISQTTVKNECTTFQPAGRIYIFIYLFFGRVAGGEKSRARFGRRRRHQRPPRGSGPPTQPVGRI